MVGEAMLEVDIPVDGVAAVVAIRPVAIAETLSIVPAAHRHLAYPFIVGIEAHQSERGGEEVQRINLVARVQIPHQHCQVHIAVASVAGKRRAGLAVLFTLDGSCRPVQIRANRIHVGRHRELILLHTEESPAHEAFRTAHRADGRIIPVEPLRRPGGLVRNQVQDTADALGIVARAGIGDNLDILDGRGRHILENLRGIAAHHHVRLPIDVNLETRAAVHRDVVVPIDRNHRHLAEHVEDGVRLRVHIVRHAVCHPVGRHLHQWLLGDNLHHGEVLHVVLYI